MKTTATILSVGLLVIAVVTIIFNKNLVNIFFHSRYFHRKLMSYHHHSESRSQEHIASHSSLNWKSLREVNGLKNKEVAILVHSTWADNGRYFRERVYPSIRTWMKHVSHVFVIIEDNANARLAFRNCPFLEDDNFTSFKCYLEPTVILSRVCDEE